MEGGKAELPPKLWFLYSQLEMLREQEGGRCQTQATCMGSDLQAAVGP